MLNLIPAKDLMKIDKVKRLVEALEVASEMLEVVNMDGTEEVAKLMSCRTMFLHALAEWSKDEM